MSKDTDAVFDEMAEAAKQFIRSLEKFIAAVEAAKPDNESRRFIEQQTRKRGKHRNDLHKRR